MSDEMTFLAGIEDLPLRTGRAFRPWSYSVSHRRLVLRTWEDSQRPVLEMEFLNVTGMKLRRTFDNLVVSEGGALPEVDEFVGLSDEDREFHRTLLLSDGTHQGFVVCSRMNLMSGL
ncbi:hypothetical protein ACIQOV_42765 [Kitasatospora sp. NPDC091257]|uniref:hypothetical protein n=1 Tax=Kitasatospora sp. NPDC091257 TaxID=3364084 RepID=UPI00380C140A